MSGSTSMKSQQKPIKCWVLSLRHAEISVTVLWEYFTVHIFNRSILESSSVVWSPYNECYVRQVEKVQEKLLRLVLFNEEYDYGR